MNVLIIPEDYRKDQYVLLPIVKAMVSAAGKPRAKVRVCQKPLLGGVGEALKWERIREIIDLYPTVQLFLLIVDRDRKEGRRIQLDRLQEASAAYLPAARYLLAENAWQEVEVWVLGAHDLPDGWNWQAVRDEENPKELYYEPFARLRGVLEEPQQGRESLATAAAQRYPRLRQRCPEVAGLEAAIRAKVG